MLKNQILLSYPSNRKLKYQVDIYKMLDSSSNELITIEHKEYVKYLGVF